MSSDLPEIYERLSLEDEPVPFAEMYRCDNCREYFDYAPIIGDNGTYCSEACQDEDDATLTDEDI